MKSKNLKRKQKTQPGGSLEPVGSALGELVVLEYQLRKWGTEMQSLATDISKSAARIGTIAERLRAMQNARAEAQPPTATVPDGNNV